MSITNIKIRYFDKYGLNLPKFYGTIVLCATNSICNYLFLRAFWLKVCYYVLFCEQVLSKTYFFKIQKMIKMIKLKVYFVTLFLLFITAADAFVGQQDPKDVIRKAADAFQLGDAEALSKNFYQTIELEIFGEENFYSQTQAIQLMKSFFERNKPVKFTINHQGVKDLSAFAIGKLQTKSNVLRVSLFLKTEDGKSYIHQLRIESDDDNNQ